MKIVINIDEEDYERLKEYKKAPFCSLTSRAYEAIANGTPLKEWLSSFNTDSAPICFNKIQELKRECERE